MNELDWLKNEESGFRDLQKQDHDAIMYFSLLWSLFEAKALNTSGSAGAIIEAAKKWDATGILKKDSFTDEATYFQNRYYGDGKLTSTLR